MRYPHLFARMYNTPLLLHPEKAKLIEEVFRSHFLGTAAPKPRAEDDRAETPEERAERQHAERSAMYAGIRLQNRPEKPYALTESGIALLPVHGTLVQRGSWMDAMSGLTSYDRIASQLDRAMADPDVRGVLLDVDSPGGEAYGLMDLASRVHAATATKPVWGVANEQAYSAAYWLLSAAERAYVAETGGVGSIGAAMLHVDQSKRDAMMGYTYTFIHAGARKVDANRHQPISKPALAWAQGEVDRLRDLFVQAVSAHRGISEESVYATEAGLLRPQEAVDGNFADGVATLLETVSLMEREMSRGSFSGTRMSAGRTSKETSMQKKDTGAAPALQAAAAAVIAALSAGETVEGLASTAQLEAARAEGMKAGEAQAEKAAEGRISAAREEGRAEGAKAERERIGAILGAEEAKGRTQLAMHLALATDQDVESAKKVLAVAPKEAGGTFAQAMASLGNPQVGPDGGDAAPEKLQITSSAQIFAARREAAKAWQQ